MIFTEINRQNNDFRDFRKIVNLDFRQILCARMQGKIKITIIYHFIYQIMNVLIFFIFLNVKKVPNLKINFAIPKIHAVKLNSTISLRVMGLSGYLSTQYSCKTKFGAVPVNVAVPPILHAYGTHNIIPCLSVAKIS